ncbi:uncharacterized protein LOC124161282 [Ischnura elegans]|uniref:uncharacterized protein LOC124161282 n=1 Tax=Ischnura elegans TaxID=197161 RepID=UPI001ED867E9|nr:uncharacterized protein LOC124161282 [Ischnura elegans]
MMMVPLVTSRTVMRRNRSFGAFLSTSLVLLLVSLVDRTVGVVDYCNDHNFDTDSTYMQFTKEISSREYTLVGKFKSIHCCAKGYRSIEWFKDGTPYPWSSGVSNLILYPESANQTVYAQTATALDKGNYSCVVRNDSHIMSHSVSLDVFEPEQDIVGYTGPPRPTYEPQDQFVSRGQSARFFCEAFVGTVDLPDAKSEVLWWRNIPSTLSAEGDSRSFSSAGEWVMATDTAAEGSNDETGPPPSVSLQDVGSRHHHHHSHHTYHRSKHHAKPKPRFHQEEVSREDFQIKGAYLLIRDVQNEDYGEYSCSIRNAGGEKKLRLSAWLREREEEEPEEVEKEIIQPPPAESSLIVYTVVGVLMIMLVLLVMMMMMAWKTNVYLMFKKYCKKREDSDGKEYGIHVFYEDKAKTFSSSTNLETSKCMTLSSIMPAFEPHLSHGYHCFTQPSPNTDHLPLTDGEKTGDDGTQG